MGGSYPAEKQAHLPAVRFFLCGTVLGKILHYYQFNIGDYASHTRHLDLLEDLAYRRILDLYYLHERPLNGDAAFVAKQIGMRDEAAIVRDVLNEFFEKTDEGYVNGRADKEIAHYHSKIEQASKAGKASAERRLNARSTDVQPTNNQEPITNNQEPINTETTSLVVSPSEKTPSAPISEIVDLYNSRLPMLPRVTVVSDSRKRLVAARWRDVVSADKLDRERGLEFFDWFFVHVGKSKFLTGRSKDWKANFEFLFTASKFPRIVEGAYHQEQT